MPHSLLQPQTLTCRGCRQSYHASHGLSRFCGPCTDALLAAQQRPRRAESLGPRWDATWPARARAESLQCHGPARECATHLLPILASGGLVVLCGDRGTGKTVMAAWLAGQMRCGVYVKAYDLFSALKASWAREATTSEPELLARWRKPRLLVIDEAQERSESEWENRTLTNLVDHRYDDLRATLLVTNQSPDTTARTLGASIIRRANQTGGVVVCDWPSYV